jgi:hypothetical protein
VTTEATAVHAQHNRLREVALVAAIGAAVGALLGLSDNLAHLATTVILSVINAVGIYVAAWLLSSGLGGRAWTARLSPGGRNGLLAAVLVVSGFAAWAVMVFCGTAFLGVRFNATDRSHSLVISIALAIAIGFAFGSFDRLRGLLAASAARLKETEFASRELETARALQNRLLPPPEIRGDGYRVAARNRAAVVVAGDFYDVFPLPNGAVGLVVADVAGKGMAAALVMASVKAMLPLMAAERNAGETLRELNNRLAAELSRREFVALAFARFDPWDGHLSLANAGLPDPYLLSDGRPQPLSVPGPRLPLGARRDVAYETLELGLAAGQRLLIVTDGLAEASLPGDRGQLGYEGLAALLSATPPTAEPLAWIDNLLGRVEQQIAGPPSDDWTALLLERELA